jgi:hypothetical protein
MKLLGRTFCKTYNLWSWDSEVVGKEIKLCHSQVSVDHWMGHD